MKSGEKTAKVYMGQISAMGKLAKLVAIVGFILLTTLVLGILKLIF